MLRLLLACFFIALASPTYARTNPCAEHRCMLVIDVGSTASRLHIFTYDLDKTNTPIHIQQIWVNIVKPGFATLEANKDTVNNYLNKLFSEAPVRQIPVYFYATAGMRLLTQAKQKIYYQEIKNWFNQNSEWQLMEAKTISGTEEALYAWLSVSYYLDRLKLPAKEAIGVIDIGGASVQIAFPLQKNVHVPKKSWREVEVYGKHIHLFAYSFLGLGQNEISHQLFDRAVCFANDYPLPNGGPGQGDATQCVQEVSLLINQVHQVKNKVQQFLDYNPVKSWYVLGGLSNLVENQPFQFPNNQLTNQDLLQQANNRVCTQSWQNLNNQFPNNKLIETSCLLPAFYYALMVNGYGLLANQTINYIPSSHNMDWTMGVVLHH